MDRIETSDESLFELLALSDKLEADIEYVFSRASRIECETLMPDILSRLERLVKLAEEHLDSEAVLAARNLNVWAFWLTKDLRPRKGQRQGGQERASQKQMETDERFSKFKADYFRLLKTEDPRDVAGMLAHIHHVHPTTSRSWIRKIKASVS